MGFARRPGSESHGAVVLDGSFYGTPLPPPLFFSFLFSGRWLRFVADLVQGGGLVLSFATRANTQESVSQLSGIIASSPCLRLTKPPLGIVRWLGSRARAILPNQNIPASVESKVRRFVYFSLV